MTVEQALQYRLAAARQWRLATTSRETVRAFRAHRMWDRIVARKVEQERAAARRAMPEPIEPLPPDTVSV